MVPPDREAHYARVICDDAVLDAKVLALDAPAYLARHARHRIHNCRFVVDGGLSRAHLICKEACVCRLIDARLWVFESRGQSLLQTLLGLRADINCLTPRRL